MFRLPWRKSVIPVATTPIGEEPLQYPSVLVRYDRYKDDPDDIIGQTGEAFIQGGWCNHSTLSLAHSAMQSIDDFRDRIRSIQVKVVGIRQHAGSKYGYHLAAVYPEPGRRVVAVGHPDIWLYFPLRIGEEFSSLNPITAMISSEVYRAIDQFALITGLYVNTIYSTNDGVFVVLESGPCGEVFDLEKFADKAKRMLSRNSEE